MDLHYQIQGQGQPLVLLHGLFGSGDNWGVVAKQFAQTNQVICVDLRNHGRSPHDESQTYQEMADDLIRLCDTLNLNNIHLLGHSLGGKVAMHFATQFSERMNKLIVVDMAIRRYADIQTYLIDAMLGVDLSVAKTRSDVDKLLSHSIDNIKVRQFLLMNLVRGNQGLYWRINLAGLKSNYNQNIRQAICANTIYHKPCLFIYGDHSDYVNQTDIAQLKQHFHQAQFANLPTGHWVHAEQPQAFIALVQQFLEQ